jgi:hypothetical protein
MVHLSSIATQPFLAGSCHAGPRVSEQFGQSSTLPFLGFQYSRSSCTTMIVVAAGSLAEKLVIAPPRCHRRVDNDLQPARTRP